MVFLAVFFSFFFDLLLFYNPTALSGVQRSTFLFAVFIVHKIFCISFVRFFFFLQCAISYYLLKNSYFYLFLCNTKLFNDTVKLPCRYFLLSLVVYYLNVYNRLRVEMFSTKQAVSRYRK